MKFHWYLDWYSYLFAHYYIPITNLITEKIVNDILNNSFMEDIKSHLYLAQHIYKTLRTIKNIEGNIH